MSSEIEVKLVEVNYKDCEGCCFNGIGYKCNASSNQMEVCLDNHENNNYTIYKKVENATNITVT